jgi:hypothetical protein
MWIFLVVYLGLIPTIIIIGGLWLINDYRRTAWLERYGNRIEAEIISLGSSNYTRPRFFLVTYRFHVDLPDQQGQIPYNRNQRITWKTFKHLKNIRKVHVVYDPNNPANARLSGPYKDYADRLTMLSVILPITIIWFSTFLNFLRMLQK